MGEEGSEGQFNLWAAMMHARDVQGLRTHEEQVSAACAMEHLFFEGYDTPQLPPVYAAVRPRDISQRQRIPGNGYGLPGLATPVATHLQEQLHASMLVPVQLPARTVSSMRAPLPPAAMFDMYGPPVPEHTLNEVVARMAAGRPDLPPLGLLLLLKKWPLYNLQKIA